MLFIDINDSLEKENIFFSEANMDNLNENNIVEIIINIAVNPNKYNPLSGSLAKEWTLSIIPERTINAPKRLNENTIIDKRMVQILSNDDFVDTHATYLNEKHITITRTNNR